LIVYVGCRSVFPLSVPTPAGDDSEQGRLAIKSYFNHEGVCSPVHQLCCHVTQKENKIFLIFKENQSGAVAKSYMRKGFVIYEEMRKYFPIYKKAVSHI
jgi:hypothetical protein